MRRYAIPALLILSLATNVAFVGFVAWKRAAHPRAGASCGGRGDEGCPCGTGLPRAMEKKLGLSPAQEAQFEGLQREFVLQRDKARDAMEELRRQLAGELDRAEPDMKKVTALVDQILAQRQTVHRAIVGKLVKQRELLDGQQRKKFDGMIKGRLAKFKGGCDGECGGKGKHGGGGACGEQGGCGECGGCGGMKSGSEGTVDTGHRQCEQPTINGGTE